MVRISEEEKITGQMMENVAHLIRLRESTHQ